MGSAEHAPNTPFTDPVSPTLATTRRPLMTRRSFVTNAATTASVAAPAAVMAPIDLSPDAELVRLGRDLNEAWQTELLADEEAVGEAVLRCCDIVKRIEGRTATTLTGLKVKALAVSWCHDGDPSNWTRCHDATPDRRLVSSILDDILAMGGVV